MENKNIVIAGPWYSRDHGNVIKNYSLYKFIEEMGNTPVFLNKPKDLSEKDYSENFSAENFINMRCNVLPVCESESDYENLNNNYDTFIISGDVWNYNSYGGAGGYFYLDFVSADKKKIAYGAGFGGNYYIPKNLKKTAEICLGTFSGISVVENESAAFIQNEFGLKPDIVLDPLFLSDKEFYCKIADYSSCNYYKEYQDKFISAIIRPDDAEKTDLIKKFGESSGMNVRVFDGSEKIEDYIWTIKNAEYIITDSYNAVCLAIILNKPFTALTYRFTQERAWFKELLGKFELSYRLYDIDNPDNRHESLFVSVKSYNESINNFIQYRRKYSQDWFINAALKNIPEIPGGGAPKLLPNFRHCEPEKVYEPVKYKIQNLIFPDCEWMEEHFWMMYRSPTGDKLFYNSFGIMPYWALQKGVAEFFTYFNSLSIRKWNRYAGARDYFLHLNIKGKFKVRFFGHWIEAKNAAANQKTLDDQLNEIRGLDINDIAKRDFIHETIREGDIKKEAFNWHSYDFSEIAGVTPDVVLPVEYKKSTIIGFEILAETPCIIYGGYYTAGCFEEDLNMVDISLATTTYKKEEFIEENIKLIKSEIFLNPYSGGMDEISNHLFVTVSEHTDNLSPDLGKGRITKNKIKADKEFKSKNMVPVQELNKSLSQDINSII